MQIVIEMSEGMYDELQTCRFPLEDAYRVVDAIIKGTVLPKGHGALKDADKLAVAIAMIRDMWDDYGSEYECAKFQAYDNCVDEIIDAPTIIEADEEADK